MPKDIHISDVRTFLACRRKWNWSSPIRGNLEPAITYAPFYTGKAVHWGVQKMYEDGESPADAAIQFAREERASMGPTFAFEEGIYQEQDDLIVGMLDHYLLWTRTFTGPYNDKELKFLALETEFTVPLNEELNLSGRFDGLVEHIPTGTVWIWENKTCKTIKSFEDGLINDLQAGAYIYAASKLFGRKVVGVMYNLLRKKLPTTPEVLKDGTLTKRANLDSTPQEYLRAALEAHPDWTKDQCIAYYKPQLDNLADKGNEFFKRLAIFRTDEEIANLVQDLIAIGEQMHNPSVPTYPTPDWMSFVGCRKCHFRAPCLAMNAGSNWQDMIASEFRKRESWDHSPETMETKDEQ